MRLPKQLIFVRHAVAVERDEFRGPDAERPLTREGIEKARGTFARAFSQLRPTRIVTSPFVRARQTAALVQEQLERKVPETLCDALVPEASWDEWVQALRKLADDWDGEDVVVLVGHEPSMSMLFAGHLGLDEPVPFKKAGIGVIEPETPTRGRLVAFLPPRFLRD